MLLRRSSIRDWHALTIRGVAEQAGVNERTVYRYFGNEQGLRNAVMRRLEEQAGIDLEGMQLEDVADVAARTLGAVSMYPLKSQRSLDPTLTDANMRQRNALLGALEDAAAAWSGSERTAAAALLDVLWSVGSYERLVADWDMDPDQAIRTLTWAIGLVEEAVNAGRRPSER
jgi:AcrR family transcriptional regulator